jgi:hypothetical protein
MRDFQTQSSRPEVRKKVEEALSVDTLKVETLELSDGQKKMDHNVSTATTNLALKINLLLERVNHLKTHSAPANSATPTSSTNNSLPASPVVTQSKPTYPRVQMSSHTS